DTFFVNSLRQTQTPPLCATHFAGILVRCISAARHSDRPRTGRGAWRTLWRRGVRPSDSAWSQACGRADDGFILATDYGQTQVTRADEFEHQRFSLATFVGVNFPVLKEYFEEGRRCRWVEPNTQEESIHTRLLSRKPAQGTVLKAMECFSKDA